MIQVRSVSLATVAQWTRLLYEVYPYYPKALLDFCIELLRQKVHPQTPHNQVIKLEEFFSVSSFWYALFMPTWILAESNAIHLSTSFWHIGQF